jgi:hypothetical protein
MLPILTAFFAGTVFWVAVENYNDGRAPISRVLLPAILAGAMLMWALKQVH